MASMSEEMKAQLMKVVGVNKEEFDQLLAKHATQISKCEDTLAKSSPFDIQMVLFKNLIESEGYTDIKEEADIPKKLSFIFKTLMKEPEFRDIRKMLPAKKQCKDGPESRRLKAEGNSNFQKGNFSESIRLYNQSIQLAPTEDESASLSLGNRSVVYFNMKQYDNCIHDCQAALHFGYPQHLQYKIYERMGRCHKILGNITEATEALNKAIAQVSLAQLTEEKKDSIQKDITEVLSNISSEGKGQQIVTYNNQLASLNLDKPHKQFPNLSSSVDVRYNPKLGRHAVANKKIKPGEVILVEEPVTWTINLDRSLLTCCRCMKKADEKMVPCASRENAVFCCLECYKLAAKTSSKPLATAVTEDEFRMSDLFALGQETSATTLLAFWSVKSQSLEFFQSNEAKLFSSVDPAFVTQEEKDWIFQGTDQIYKCMYNLVSHMESMTKDSEAHLLITSAVLVRFLQEFNYFPSPSTDGEMTEAEVLIGRLLFQFQCGIKFNQHGIYQIDSQVEAGKNLPLNDSGIAVYPTLLFLNHSCCPNTIRVNHGKKMFLMAKTVIEAGQEVSDGYGIHHLSMGKEDRQTKLERGFKFDCVCSACEENWPTFPHLEASLTQSETGRLGNHLSTYQKEFKAGRYGLAFEQCQTYLHKLHDLHIQQPHRNYEIGSLAMASAVWATLA